MKLRILNFGFSATHRQFTELADFGDPASISDFDAFVFDPMVFQGKTVSGIFNRRKQEISDLVHLKGGIVVCPLRANIFVNFQGSGSVRAYELVDDLQPKASGFIQNLIRAGEGSRIRTRPGTRGVITQYLRVLQDNLRFAAHFETGIANLETAEGTVFAVDSVGYPIAVEFRAGDGRVCFVPVPHAATGDRVGSAIARIVEAHYGGAADTEIPPWADQISVPGAAAFDSQIAELEQKRDQIGEQLASLSAKRAVISNYRRLLYGSGKAILETVVRDAFRILGFEIPEPDSYSGEWDVELHEITSGKTAIAEVEGSEGVVDVDKFRQLLEYVQAEFLLDRDHKGILVGNGYRLTELNAPERQKQFSDHALKGGHEK